MNIAHQNILRYIAKCVVGTLVLFAANEALPWVDFSWVLISMLLVLSPDGKEAIPLTVVRVKANFVASVVTILMLLISSTVLVALLASISLTIVCCYVLQLMAGSRAALAAAVIIAQHPPGAHLWSTAEERVLSVVVGCILALVLTFAFHRGMALSTLMQNDKSSE